MIPKLTLVQIKASSSGKPTIELWQPQAWEQPSLTVTNKVFGVTMTDSEYGEPIACISIGYVRGCPEQNGETWAIGDTLWARQDGSATKTRPDAPWPSVFIGTVFADEGTGGPFTVAVCVRILPSLGELSGVERETPENHDVFVFDSGSHVWEPRELRWSDIAALCTISVTTGLVAGAPVTPGAHGSTHEDGGSDEISVDGLSGTLADAQKVAVRKNSGSTVGTRKRLNLIEGSNVTLTVADDGTDDEVDVTIASSGGTGGGLQYPDEPPASPNTEDDEFDDTSLDAKWTETSTAASVDYGGDIPSCVSAYFSGNQSYQLAQDYAPSGAFALTAKFNVFALDNYAQCYIDCFDDDESDGIRAAYVTVVGYLRWSFSVKTTGSWSYDTFYATVQAMTVGTVFIHVARDGSNNWSLWASSDGRAWGRIGTTAKTLSMDHFVLSVDQNGQTRPCRMCIDWVRRDWLSL
jgi:hypothetical protein